MWLLLLWFARDYYCWYISGCSLLSLGQLGSWGQEVLQDTLSPTSSIHLPCFLLFPMTQLNYHLLSFMFYCPTPCSSRPSSSPLSLGVSMFCSGCFSPYIIRGLSIFIGTDAFSLSSFHQIFVRDNKRPSNLYDSPHAGKLKCIKLSCISFVHFPCFTAV